MMNSDSGLKVGAGMFRKDFRPCAFCGKGVMHTGLPLFWRVCIERMGVDLVAAQRQHGMEVFFGGNVGIADVFNDGAPIANPLQDSEKTILICERCAMEPKAIAEILE